MVTGQVEPGLLCRVSRGASPAETLRTILRMSDLPNASTQRMVASWDRAPHLWEPTARSHPGRPHTRALVKALMQPVGSVGPVPPKCVLHVTVALMANASPPRLHHWAQLSAAVVDYTGVSRYGDDGGCRWVAMRATSTRLHVIATLARQDHHPVALTGTTTGLTDLARAHLCPPRPS